MKRKRHMGIIAIIALFIFTLATSLQASAQTRRRTTATRDTKIKLKDNPVSKPYTGYNKQPAGKAVDLGLSVLWADRNVGAANPGDEGGLFHWGSVTGLIGKFAKHEMKPTGMPEIFSSTFDTAHMAWGGDWRMPSVEDFIELFTVCKMTMVVNNEGYSMLRLTGPNGNSISLPITGAIHWPGNQELERDDANQCCYWTGETNRDTITVIKGKVYKMKPNFYSDPNEPMYAEYNFPIWPTWSFHPTLEHFNMRSLASCNRETWAMAVRPVMDRDGLPTAATYESCKEIIESNSKKDSAKNQTLRKPNGGKAGNGNKSNGKSTNAKPNKQQPTNNGRPKRNGYSSSTSSNKPLIPNHNNNGSNKDTDKSRQVGNNGLQRGDNGYNNGNQQQNDAPIPTPRPKRNDWDTVPPPPHREQTPIAKEHAVDLGLSVYWSDCNIGAESIADTGDFFFWGVTEPKELTAQTVDLKGMPFNIENINGTEYDIASARWSKRWRMPTKEEIQELIDNCTFELATIKGQKGVKIIGKNKRWIFMPFGAAYDPHEGKPMLDGWGAIWSATEGKKNLPAAAFGAIFSPFGKSEIMEVPKNLLINVRPVTKRLLPHKTQKPH